MHRAIQLTLFSEFVLVVVVDFFFFHFRCSFFPLVDPCHQYRTLNSSDRNVNDAESPDQLSCDEQLRFSRSGWYRFQGAAGTRLPTKCTQSKRCHTDFPGCLNVKHKPLPSEGVTEGSIRVCFKKVSNCDCCAVQHAIFIKNCSSYFVYKLFPPPGCKRRYWGTD